MNKTITSASYIDPEHTKVAINYDGDNDISWVTYGQCSELENWISQGNSIDPYVDPGEPVNIELTPQQKLEAAGLTVDELKELLGL